MQTDLDSRHTPYLLLCFLFFSYTKSTTSVQEQQVNLTVIINAPHFEYLPVFFSGALFNFELKLTSRPHPLCFSLGNRKKEEKVKTYVDVKARLEHFCFMLRMWKIFKFKNRAQEVTNSFMRRISWIPTIGYLLWYFCVRSMRLEVDLLWVSALKHYQREYVIHISLISLFYPITAYLCSIHKNIWIFEC